MNPSDLTVDLPMDNDPKVPPGSATLTSLYLRRHTFKRMQGMGAMSPPPPPPPPRIQAPLTKSGRACILGCWAGLWVHRDCFTSRDEKRLQEKEKQTY